MTAGMGSTPAAPPAPIPGVATMRSDIVAGLVSSTIAIPLAMAFGMFAFVTLGDEYFAYGAMAGLISAVIAGLVSVLLGDRSTRVYAPRITTTFFLGLLLFSLLHRDPTRERRTQRLRHAAGVLRHHPARRPVSGAVRNAAAGLVDKIRAASGDGGFPEHGRGAAVPGAARQRAGLSSTTFPLPACSARSARRKPLSLVVAALTFAAMWNARRLSTKVPPVLVGLGCGAIVYSCHSCFSASATCWAR